MWGRGEGERGGEEHDFTRLGEKKNMEASIEANFMPHHRHTKKNQKNKKINNKKKVNNKKRKEKGQK